MFNDNGLGDADACPAAAIGQRITAAWPVLLQHGRSFMASTDPESHADQCQDILNRIRASMRLAVLTPAKTAAGLQVQLAVGLDVATQIAHGRGDDPFVVEHSTIVIRCLQAVAAWIAEHHAAPVDGLGIEEHYAQSALDDLAEEALA